MVGSEASTITRIARQIGEPAEAVDAAVVRLVQAGLVQRGGDWVRLSEQGRVIVARLPSTTAANTRQVASTDAGEVPPSIDSLWSAYVEHRAAARGRARNKLLAADEDRDAASQLLADAFAQGRLSSSEFEARTGRALSATTYGELDDVLQGLGGLQRPAGSHPVRKGVFGVVALVSSPFLLVGTALLLGGSDTDDRISGVVLLILFLPGLLALWRWAWPRG